MSPKTEVKERQSDGWEDFTQEYIDAHKTGKFCTCEVCICSTEYVCKTRDDCKDCKCGEIPI